MAKDFEKFWPLLEEVCRLPHKVITQDQIVDILKAAGHEVSKPTLQRAIRDRAGCTFDQFREQKQGGLKAKLILKAIDMAMKGNTALMIFLLKSLCGMADKTPEEIEAMRGTPAVKPMTEEDVKALVKIAKGEAAKE